MHEIISSGSMVQKYGTEFPDKLMHTQILLPAMQSFITADIFYNNLLFPQDISSYQDFPALDLLPPPLFFPLNPL